MTDGEDVGWTTETASTLGTTENLYGKQVEKL
jgi:hypothetical protein